MWSSQNTWTLMLKSSFPEKATKFWKNLSLVLTLLSKSSCFFKRGGRNKKPKKSEKALSSKIMPFRQNANKIEFGPTEISYLLLDNTWIPSNPKPKLFLGLFFLFLNAKPSSSPSMVIIFLISSLETIANRTHSILPKLPQISLIYAIIGCP